MSTKEEEPVSTFVRDLQSRGYTKYATTQEVMVQYELPYDQAYYQVREEQP